jgi:very-short-patch-repair endonuclease
VNLPVGRFTVDFLWNAEHLIVELDGYRAHAGRTAFEADRTRDMELKALGYEVVRLTWQQIMTRSARVAPMLRKLLRARGQ